MKYLIIMTLLCLSFCLSENSFAGEVRMQPNAATAPAARTAEPAVPPSRTPQVTPSVSPRVSPSPVTPQREIPGPSTIRQRPKVIQQVTVLPDLSITRSSASPQKISPGDKVRLSAEVKNSGDVALRRVKVIFMRDRKTLGETFITIGARATAHAEVTVPLVGIGRVSIEALVDPDRQITESNEQNNKTQLLVTSVPPAVTPAPMLITAAQPAALSSGNTSAQQIARAVIKPDLSPLSLTLNKTDVSVGEMVIAKVLIKNFSRETLSDVPIAFYDNTKRTEARTITIPAHNTVPAIFAFNAKQGGIHELSVTVDPENIIDERNEHNNVSQVKLEVKQPRLAKDSGKQLTLVNPGTLPDNNDAPSKVEAQPLKASVLTPAKRAPTAEGRVQAQQKTEGSTPFGASLFQIIEPKQGETWLNNKTYAIKWLLSGSTAVVKKITLRRALQEDIVESTIPPGFLPKDNNNMTSVNFTVPASTEEGDYFIRIEAEETVNGKTESLKADSAVFRISWHLTGIAAGKAEVPDTGKLLDVASKLPQITFFDYSKTVTGCSGLDIQFYWKYGGENLHDGTWTLEWQTSTGWTKKSGSIADLPMAADFNAVQGLAKIPLPFCEEKGSAIPIKFFIADKFGLASNIVTGTVNAGKGPQIQPPPVLTDPLVFISPPNASWREELQYFPGDQVPVKIQINAAAQLKTVTVKLELEDPVGIVPTQTINSSSTANNGQLYTYTWIVPATFEKGSGRYRFKASSPELDATAKSNKFSIVDEGISITSPARGTPYNVGDTVVFKWNSHGLPNNTGIHIDLHTTRSGSSKTVRLTTSPIAASTGTWSWKIEPSTVPEGECVLTFEPYGGGSPLGYTSVLINYPNTIEKPGITFKKPAAWQTTKWLAGASESIEWRQQGNIGGTEIYFELMSTIQSSSYGGYSIGTTTAPSFVEGSYLASIPAQVPSGPYRLVATSPTLGPLGESGILEVVNADMTITEGPAYNTKFEITRVDYPVAGGFMIVHVQVDAPKPFRLGTTANPTLGDQAVSCQITNYLDGAPPQVAAVAMVSVKNDSTLFPKHVFPAGKSTYMITITPKLVNPVSPYKTIQNMASGPFEGGDLCISTRFPKLQVNLQTNLPGGQGVTTSWNNYLMNVSGMQERSEHLPGSTSGCRGDNPW